MYMRKRVSFIALLAFLPMLVMSQVNLPKILGDNMVLQQGKKVNIWGTASPGEKVTVKFQKQNKKTVAGEDGRWSVQLDELTATHKPQQMTVSGQKNKIRLKNILIGEVWLASGQSNMEYSMNNHPKYAKPAKGNPERLKEEFLNANSPIIRVLHVKRDLKSDTLPSNGWKTLSQESLAPVSAVGYFFAKKIMEELNVPVGIISTSWGGTPIETWTSEQAYAESDYFKNQLKNHKIGGRTVGERYEKMVRPMIPFTLKGFLWYQGEANLLNGDLDVYKEKKRTMIESWRADWSDESLPFYYVQLAPYHYSGRKMDIDGTPWDALPKFWEAQTACLEIPNTGMIVTTDLVDDIKDIHPSYKWIVGERLANLALAKTYNKEDVCYSGPVFKKMTVEDTKIIIEFDHAEGGLVTSDGKAPDWFKVKYRGRFYKPQSSYIEGNKVILVHDQLYHPAAVRFAWDDVATPNLMNKAGLPARPFQAAE